METQLIDFLNHHSDEQLKSIPDMELSELCKKNDVDSMEKILKNFEIWPSTVNLSNFNLEILELAQSKRAVKKFKILAYYPMWLSIAFFIIYPILIENYWFYFFILLLPLSIMASGILKSPFQTFFWLVLLVLIAVSVFTSNANFIPIIITLYLLKTIPQRAKRFYRSSIINAAIKDKLKFKFLYVIGMINLYDPINDELIMHE